MAPMMIKACIYQKYKKNPCLNVSLLSLFPCSNCSQVKIFPARFPDQIFPHQNFPCSKCSLLDSLLNIFTSQFPVQNFPVQLPALKFTCSILRSDFSLLKILPSAQFPAQNYEVELSFYPYSQFENKNKNVSIC